MAYASPAYRSTVSINIGMTGSAIKNFGTAEQKDRVVQRLEQACRWLLVNSPKETEDRVFRLWALKLAGAAGDQRGCGERGREGLADVHLSRWCHRFDARGAAGL